MEFSENTSQEVDVDELLKGIDSPEPERAMTSEPAAPQPEQVAAQPVVQEYEFDWNGRKIKAPVDRLTKWASQGYDYAQKMEAFKKQQTELESKYKPYEKYKTIDDYVQKDPQWWEFVEQQWQNRAQVQDPTLKRALDKQKEEFNQEIAPVKEFFTKMQEQKAQEKIQKEDTALSEDIKSIRSKYADLDFDTPDAEGKSLEHKVLEHGSVNGFPSFKAAFLDFYHEQLEKMWESRGREAVSKETQKRQKLGLSSSSSTPKRATAEGINITGKNYNQILEEIMGNL